MKKVLTKFSILVGSLITTFILLEAILATISYYATPQYSHAPTLSKNKSSIIITCIGESTTALGGSDSYPSQLQKLLHPLPIRVINRGLPGATTNQILKELKTILSIDKPDIVLVMTGINDAFYSIWRSPLGYLNHSRAARLLSWIYHSTILRFQQIPKEDHNPSNMKTGPILDNYKMNNFNKVVALYASSPKYKSDKSATNLTIKSLLALSHELDLLKILHDAHLRNVIMLGDYTYLIHDYLEGKDVANDNFLFPLLDLYISSLSKFTIQQATTFLWWYPKIILPRLRRRSNVMQIKKRLSTTLNTINKHFPNHSAPLERDILRFLSEQMKEHTIQQLPQSDVLRSPLSKENHLRIISMIKAEGSIPVVMQYPMRNINELKTLHGKSIEYYISNNNFFPELKKHGPSAIFSDFFAGDFGHATHLGNSIVAKNAYNMINKILRDHPINSIQENE